MASSISQAFLFSIILFLSINKACSDLPGEKNTHLHFYFHELISGSNATILQVVQAPNNTGFTFGAMPVRRVQGLVVASGKDGSLSTMLNFVFNDGAYNGSTLAIYGWFVLGNGITIERPVIGGTGAFRMARGYSIASPVIIISSTEYVYEYI
ncbi:Dirigent protein 11 [Carex littledalei]|uniref:Dirigent protein n=1 Tax=Carex littledalei TaxID=544730 RepID=A0A833VGW5_9POAL|nr:Dirigent protein 11 [Carex littledalei]